MRHRGGGGWIPPPLITPPLKGLEGGFFSMRGIYTNYIYRKRNSKNPSKRRPKVAKILQRHFWALLSKTFVFTILKSVLGIKA